MYSTPAFEISRGQHLRAQNLVADRQDDLLLAPGAVKIAALGLTGASIGQGELTGHGLYTGLQGLDVVIAEGVNRDFLWHVDLDAADLVDEAHEGVEVDLGIVIDRHPEQLFHSFGCQGRSAAGQLIRLAELVSSIDPAVVKTTGYIDPQITRDGEHAGGVIERVQGEQDHRIGARRSFTGLPIAIIQTHHQQSDPAGAVPGYRGRADCRSGLLSDWNIGGFSPRLRSGGGVQHYGHAGQAGQIPGGDEVAHADIG